MPQTKSSNESSSQPMNGGKKCNKSNMDDPKVQENIARELYNDFQCRFDLSLIASVAHACQWNIEATRKALLFICKTNDFKTSKNFITRPMCERKNNEKNLPNSQKQMTKKTAKNSPQNLKQMTKNKALKNSPENQKQMTKNNAKNSLQNHHQMTENRAKSLPGTLKDDKCEAKKCVSSSSLPHHYGSTNSFASGQVWQRHYKSKPQSPGLLTMIPPRDKETIKLSAPDAGNVASDQVKTEMSPSIKKIQSLVRRGVKVLILMRGLPGSGKTHLAGSIVNFVVEKKVVQHIFSSDDYFIMLGRGIYAYDRDQLPQAHSWNHERVFKSLKRGINPIIVDNTNIQIREMEPYVAMAINHGYLVKVLEPDTPWRFNAIELANKNVHSVPLKVIKEMMVKYKSGVTGKKLMASMRLKYNHGEATSAEKPIAESPIVWRHEPKRLSKESMTKKAPEKPERKACGSKKKQFCRPTETEMTEDREKNLEKLSQWFEENGKKLSPASRRKVLESGVSIAELISRLGKWKESNKPLVEANIPRSTSWKAEPERWSDPFKAVPCDHSTNRRESLLEYDPDRDPDTASSSDSSEASESETDTEENEEEEEERSESNQEMMKNYFGRHVSNYVVGDGEAMAEGGEFGDDGEDVRNEIAENSSESAFLIDQEESTRTTNLDMIGATSSSDLNDFILLNLNDDGDPPRENFSSGSEDSCFEEMKKASGNFQGNTEETDRSLANAFDKRFDETENHSEFKMESESIGNGGSIDGWLLELAVQKYGKSGNEDSVMANVDDSGSKKSPDLEEVPLPSIPPEENSEKEISADWHEFKTDKFEDIVNSWNHSTVADSTKSDVSPKRERPKSSFSGAIKKTGINSRDKSPDELLRSVELTWSSVNFTSSWEDVNQKKPSESSAQSKFLPKPKRKFVSKSDSSTNTIYGDFDLWRKDDEGIVKLIAHSRNINQNYVLPEFPVSHVTEILMVDKSSMTSDAEEENCLGRENALDTLSGMFPDISKENLADILENCNGNVFWAIEVLLETPQNLANVTETVSEEKTFGSVAKAMANEPHYVSFQDAIVTDGRKTIKRKKDKKTSDSELSLLLKKQIEESIQINEDFYQDKTLFLKKLRRGEIEFGDGPIELPPIEQSVETFAEESRHIWENEEYEGDEEEKEEESISMKIDQEFLKNFCQQFGTFDDCCNVEHLMDLVSPVINIPVSLAQQIHDCWAENVMKQLEDLQIAYDRMMTEDEALAIRLQEQEFEYRQPDLREIMDMELAMLLYKQSQAQLNKMSEETMATKLSKQLLFEAYPNVDKKKLLDLFESEGRSLHRTIDVLGKEENESPLSVVAPEFLAAHSAKLLEQAKAEKFKETVEEVKTQKIVAKPSVTKKVHESEKGVFLMNPVEYRQKIALLHRQRNECFQKAQKAFQKRSFSVASYFSYLSGLYKNRINALSKEPFPQDLFDDKLGQEITKIDLHFLFVSEALQVVDLFLDHHIKKLRRKNCNSVKVDLITGRGQHSRKGNSQIKPAVIKKLKQRKFSYVLNNPGLLKVTICKYNLLLDEM